MSTKSSKSQAKDSRSKPIAKFRRILWEPQPFDDNYTPPSFPRCVVFNEGARFRSFGYLLIHSLWVLDHISLVVLFFDVFLLCDNGSIYSTSLFTIDVLLVLSGLIISIILLYLHTSQSTSSSTLSSIKSKIERTYVMGILLIILCPFLRTLTESISTDTIWTMTIICCLIHLLTADYGFDKYKNGGTDNKSIQFSISESYDPKITATVSLNAAAFMSVLLGSRLKSNDLALSFLLFSFILFGGSPYIIRDLKLINTSFNIIVSIIICVCNYALIWYQQEIFNQLSFIALYIRDALPSEIRNALPPEQTQEKIYDYRNDIRLSSLVYVYQYSMFVIVILGPIGFYRIQQYKVTIGGPWTYDSEGEASQYMIDSSNIKKQS